MATLVTGDNEWKTAHTLSHSKTTDAAVLIQVTFVCPILDSRGGWNEEDERLRYVAPSNTWVRFPVDFLICKIYLMTRCPSVVVADALASEPLLCFAPVKLSWPSSRCGAAVRHFAYWVIELGFISQHLCCLVISVCCLVLVVDFEQLQRSSAGVHTTMLLTGGPLAFCCSHWWQERWWHINPVLTGSRCGHLPFIDHCALCFFPVSVSSTRRVGPQYHAGQGQRFSLCHPQDPQLCSDVTAQWG